jgi:uncharacterized protein (DUF433 family)
MKCDAILTARRTIFNVYGKDDPRRLAAYTISEAAHYLTVPRATLASWVMGRPYPTRQGTRFFEPVFLLPDRKSRQLSFVNLVEAHVLNAIRHEHNIPLDKVRKSVEYLRRQFGSRHPLAEYKFETDGIDLFVQRYGELINTSQAGQLAMRELLQWFLHRVEWDNSGKAIKLYPFTRKPAPDAPKVVVIDPRLSFGRPVITGTGITTSIVAERYKAGDSIEELAKDYGRPPAEIEEAIRCELPLEAA